MHQRVGAILALAFIAAAFVQADPLRTGAHLELVRAFHTTAHGLPTNDMRAIGAARNGVFAAAGEALVQLQGERWTRVDGPARVTALMAAERESFAGAHDGVWMQTGGRWQKEANSPPAVVAFNLAPDNIVWALAPGGLWKRDPGWQRVHQLDADMQKPQSLVSMGGENVYVADAAGLFGLMGKRKYWLLVEQRPGELVSANTRGLARLDNAHFLVATDKGLNLTDGKRGWQTFTGAEGLPLLDLTHVAVSQPANQPVSVWLGTDDGLLRWQGGKFHYLAGMRWLPDNKVTCLAAAPDGSVWIGTPKGLAHLYTRTMTLEQKSEQMQKTLDARNRRYNYVTVMQLKQPGVVEGAEQEISDNDGLWTGMHIAAQSYRYAVTRTPEAKAWAVKSMKALLDLERLTGLSGFPARAVCRVDEPEFGRRSLRHDNEWHESPLDRQWWWKGDTSSDEIDGHYFAWFVFDRLVDDAAMKEQVRATCKRVTDHILDHGLYLVDFDGKPTTWGVWAAEKINDDPKWWEERGLNSLEILSHLKVAHRLVGDARYEAKYRELIEKHHYALNALNAKLPAGVSHDDQLAMLAYYPLLQLERDPALRALYVASMRRTWKMVRHEANPLWNFIYGSCTGASCDAEAAVETLREIPLDLIRYKVRNSHRADLQWDAEAEKRGEKKLVTPLSFLERQINNWDANVYRPDGGSDLGEGDPTIWLLPYWMGRFYKLIE